MKQHRPTVLVGIGLVLFALGLYACTQPTPPPPTPEPTPVPTTTPSPQPEPTPTSEAGAAAYAVDLVAAWVEGGVHETDPFDYTGIDGNTYQGTFEADVLPLFTQNNVWHEGSQACVGCHFGTGEASYHQLNFSSYEGFRTGADSLEEPPGVSILGESAPGVGDFDWEASKLRERLRNNRMPPGFPFVLDETNRNGPCLVVSAEGAEVQRDDDGQIEYDCEVNAVGLVEAWVLAGAPETDPFGYGGANLTFATAVLPFFTQPDMWFDGSQACAGCHFAASEASYHQLNLSSYEGIRTGADSLEEPPGVSILGESAPGVGDFDWEHSKLRGRLRNNRMPPGSIFDITEVNRDGPLVLAGRHK